MPPGNTPARACVSERSAMSVAKTLMSNRLSTFSASSTGSMASVYASSPVEQAVIQTRIDDSSGRSATSGRITRS